MLYIQLPSRNIMVQICGGGVVPIVFKTCGNWRGPAWYISIVSISISSIVSQVEKAVSPWCRLLSYWVVQFHEVLERLVWNGCLLCNQVRGFLEYALRTVEGSEFVARVVCAGGKRLTPWRCQDKAVIRVGVAYGGFV
jgi:hypothetical protein